MNNDEVKPKQHGEESGDFIDTGGALTEMHETVSDPNSTASTRQTTSHLSRVLPGLLVITLVAMAVLAFFFPDRTVAFALAGTAILVAAILWYVPKLQIAHLKSLDPQERFSHENEARKTLAQIVGGIVVLAGLYYTQDNIRTTQDVAEKSRTLTREGQVTDRFNRAIDALGDKSNLSKRLGGIYSLERISLESKADYWTIIEVLTAYVRENGSWSKAQEPGTSSAPPENEAVINILRRRNWSNETEDQIINLQGANLAAMDLRSMILNGARFSRASLSQANLEQAKLIKAQFDDADLGGAQLMSANITGARFHKSDLRHANLSGAILSHTFFQQSDSRNAQFVNCELIENQFHSANLANASFDSASLTNVAFGSADLREASFLGARLSNVYLGEADLTRTYLMGVDLTATEGLTQKQLDKAYTDGNTRVRSPLVVHPKLPPPNN